MPSDDGLLPSSFEPEQVIRVLHKHGVRYVLIGGLAAALHGSPQPTVDIDLTPEQSGANLDALASALRELGATRTTDIHNLRPPNDRNDFIERVEVFFSAVGEVDVLREALGVGGYAELINDSVAFVLSGIEIKVMSLESLIESKEVANRIKDQLALVQLRLLRDELNNS